MNDQIRQQLIGYVLGALEEPEQRHVTQQLQRDPLWQQELESVQRCLEPLADGCVEHDPPPDLVAKTCCRVYAAAEQQRVERGSCRRLPWKDGGFDFGRGWRLADWIVVAGICLVAVALFFPAVLQSRIASRTGFCKNNLRELGMMLTQFSETTQERFFPVVPTEGRRAFAGVYGPTLQEARLLQHSRQVVCPDSPLANELAGFRVPSLQEIDTATDDRILILQRIAGGTYAYTLGFMCQGRHTPVCNLGRAYFVVMADSPALDLGRLAAHGSGFNVLYEDGHVRYLANWPRDQRMTMDNPFCNRLGRTEAGTDVEDAVVAPSYCPPVLRRVFDQLTQ